MIKALVHVCMPMTPCHCVTTLNLTVMTIKELFLTVVGCGKTDY
mgnify:CR=1 FL=1